MLTKNQTLLMNFAKFEDLLYILITLSGEYIVGCISYIINSVGHASISVQNGMDQTGMFRIGILDEIFDMVLEIILTAILYAFEIDQLQSFALAFFGACTEWKIVLRFLIEATQV